MTKEQEHIKKTVDTICEESANKLMEYADSVQIFVTFRDGGQCGSTGITRGNIFAALGQVSEWLTMRDQLIRNVMKPNKLGEDDA